jgi:hypothetical protein
MKYNIKAKSGIIIDCSKIGVKRFRVVAESIDSFHLYYVDKENIDSLQSTGEWKDLFSIMYLKEGVTKVDDIIRVTVSQSYFFIMNFNSVDIEVHFEIQENINTWESYLGINGFGVSGLSATNDKS